MATKEQVRESLEAVLVPSAGKGGLNRAKRSPAYDWSYRLRSGPVPAIGT